MISLISLEHITSLAVSLRQCDFWKVLHLSQAAVEQTLKPSTALSEARPALEQGSARSALHCGQEQRQAGSSAKEARAPASLPPCHFPVVSVETNPIPLDKCTARLFAPVIVKVAYPLVN